MASGLVELTRDVGFGLLFEDAIEDLMAAGTLELRSTLGARSCVLGGFPLCASPPVRTASVDAFRYFNGSRGT